MTAHKKELYLNWRNRFLTSFFQFEVQIPLEQIKIYLILENMFLFLNERNYIFNIIRFRKYFFDSNTILAKT